jgi:probable phosphoglycerate mutase
MPTIWFIRHAESESNIGLPTFSPASIKLTEQGFKQAQQIAQAFEQPPDLVVTSSYLRTKQTAQATIERFPESRLAEWPVHEFTYLSPARHYNTTIQQRKPLACAFWERQDPFYIDGEGAESFADFIQRVQQVLDYLHCLDDDFVSIFSHEQFIKALMWTTFFAPGASTSLSPQKMQSFYRFLTLFTIPNGALIKVQARSCGELWFSPVIATHLTD